MTPSPVSDSAEFSYDLLWFRFSPADGFQMKALPVLSAWTVFNWLLQHIKYLPWLNSLWNGIKLFLSVCSLSGRQISQSLIIVLYSNMITGFRKKTNQF